MGDEVTFIQKRSRRAVRERGFHVFRLRPGFTRKHWKTARERGQRDRRSSYALEDEAGAPFRAPWVERELGTPPRIAAAPVVVAHPAAVVLALLVRARKRRASVRRRDCHRVRAGFGTRQEGMDELHEQTVNLLSFQQLPKAVFDAQVAFNLVDRYGEKSAPALAIGRAARILDHYQHIAGRSCRAFADAGAGSNLPRPRVFALH